jgi:hypothetical protein
MSAPQLVFCIKSWAETVPPRTDSAIKSYRSTQSLPDEGVAQGSERQKNVA